MGGRVIDNAPVSQLLFAGAAKIISPAQSLPFLPGTYKYRYSTGRADFIGIIS